MTLEAALTLTTEPHLSLADRELALRALRTYFRRYPGEDQEPNFAARVEFHLADVRPGWSGSRRLTFVLKAPKGREIEREGWSGPRKGKRYGAAERLPPITREFSLPSEPELVYRGMSWEEWSAAMRAKVVASRGLYNLGAEQRGLTFFTPEADGALYYASGFAPEAYKAAITRPAVVIGVSRRWVACAGPGIPEGECAAKHPIPITAVERVWLVAPQEVLDGKLVIEITRDRVEVIDARWPDRHSLAIKRIR